MEDLTENSASSCDLVSGRKLGEAHHASEDGYFPTSHNSTEKSTSNFSKKSIDERIHSAISFHLKLKQKTCLK